MKPPRSTLAHEKKEDNTNRQKGRQQQPTSIQWVCVCLCVCVCRCVGFQEGSNRVSAE
jgi:hypothetical protein